MANTSNYKTKTTIISRKNVSVESIWGLALDIGYSSVKGMSPNSVYRFPSYARKAKQLLSMAECEESDIYYKDSESGQIWAVGEKAQSMITLEDTADSSSSLYGRNRYFESSFLVIARTGIGLGLIANEFGSPAGKPLVVQTGLPPKYIKNDSELLKEALEGHHSFEIKIGRGQWQKFCFDLPRENVIIIPQPMGTLLSICTDKNGLKIQEARKYFNSSLLIFDPGFGTFDVFDIRGGAINNFETFDYLGMKRVFEETADEIYKRYKMDVSIPAMQKYLETGEINVTDRKLMKTENVPFGNILFDKSKMVCDEAIEKIKTLYNNLFEHDYLVITGGTGAAWDYNVRQHFSGLSNLKIIAGNQNDNLSYVFSNVRGYYMYLVGNLKKQAA